VCMLHSALGRGGWGLGVREAAEVCVCVCMLHSALGPAGIGRLPIGFSLKGTPEHRPRRAQVIYILFIGIKYAV